MTTPPPAAAATDIDREETREWVDAIEAVLAREGPGRAHFLLERIIDHARRNGAYLPYRADTAYINTIPPSRQAPAPGDHDIEGRIRSFVRWNALAMVVRANRKPGDLGGHIASFASAATLYDVAFNHFFRASSRAENGDATRGDLVFFQGHCAPGVYARAFLEGRLSESQLENFRAETDGGGLSSYPHPWLMPDFWQFPTVSMGLGPLMAIYQARFLRYLENRGVVPKSDRKVWAFMGDGEMDEPESMGAISLAAREELDNLIFVVNCNLQRLDGPGARQRQNHPRTRRRVSRPRLECHQSRLGILLGSAHRARQIRPALAADGRGRRRRLPNLQSQRRQLCARAFFRPPSRTQADGGDDDRSRHLALKPRRPRPAQGLRRLSRRFPPSRAADGRFGQDHQGLRHGRRRRGAQHHAPAKEISDAALKRIRDRFHLPISDEEIGSVPFVKFAPDSREAKYLRERAEAMGGSLPRRAAKAPQRKAPPLSAFKALLQASDKREYSTTMAFVRALNALVKDPAVGSAIVPIVADESRTFGMEGMFRQLGIYSLKGQRYRPEDADQLMYYREDSKGQILQEGICEAGAFSSWLAAATS